MNVALFWEKVDFSEYIPLVPTSAITGDGMGDLIALLVNYSEKVIPQQLTLSMELEAVVMEVSTCTNKHSVLLLCTVLPDCVTHSGEGNSWPWYNC